MPVCTTTLSDPVAAAAYTITGTTAVLVRPDGHIAGRLEPDELLGPVAARSKLSELIDAVTGRTG